MSTGEKHQKFSGVCQQMSSVLHCLMPGPHSTGGTALVSAKDLTAEHSALESIGPDTERVALSTAVQC